MTRWGALLLWFLLTHCAYAGTRWVEGTKTNAPGCGTARATACATWNYLLTAGCDADGCANNIQADLTSGGTNSTVHFVCNANAGGTCQSAQTYAGDGNGRPFCVGFDGQATSELTIDCTDGAGTPQHMARGSELCIISGAGLTYSPPDIGVVNFGRSSVNCSASDGTAYVKWDGFRVQDPPSGSASPVVRYGWSGTSTNHIKSSWGKVDGGTTATTDLSIALAGTSYLTYQDWEIVNHAQSAFGGFAFQQPQSHITGIRVKSGHRRDFPGPYNAGAGSNNDCITLQGVDTARFDGVECYETPDGLDIGMLDSSQSKNIQVRYSWIHDIFGNPNSYGSRLAKVSGDASTVTNAQDYTFSRNLFSYTNPAWWRGGFWVTELGLRVDFRGNTMFGGQHVLDDCTMGYLDINDGGGVADRADRVQWRDNILDGITTGKLSGACSCATNQVCPLWLNEATCTSANCFMENNQLWFAERGGSAPCIYEKPSGGAAVTFNCDLTRVGGGAAFNSTGSNTRNVRSDPIFASRGAATPSGYVLTGASAALDAGDPFCTASDAVGSPGNTINVTCTGTSTDPRRYFWDPADSYSVSNNDCKGGPIKDVSATNPGCYDIQIEGACGVRQIVSMTATSITFNGAACAWSAAALVDDPWSGTRRDRGAVESTGSTVTTTTTTTSTSTTTTTIPGSTVTPPGNVVTRIPKGTPLQADVVVVPVDLSLLGQVTVAKGIARLTPGMLFLPQVRVDSRSLP